MLVTHNLAFLDQTDQILLVSDGKITEKGSYQQLIQQNGEFAQLLTFMEQKGNKSLRPLFF